MKVALLGKEIKTIASLIHNPVDEFENIFLSPIPDPREFFAPLPF